MATLGDWFDYLSNAAANTAQLNWNPQSSSFGNFGPNTVGPRPPGPTVMNAQPAAWQHPYGMPWPPGQVPGYGGGAAPATPAAPPTAPAAPPRPPAGPLAANPNAPASNAQNVNANTPTANALNRFVTIDRPNAPAGGRSGGGPLQMGALNLGALFGRGAPPGAAAPNAQIGSRAPAVPPVMPASIAAARRAQGPLAMFGGNYGYGYGTGLG